MPNEEEIPSEEKMPSDKENGDGQFVGVDLWVDSQEEEYELIDDTKLEMLRLLIPGYTECFQVKKKVVCWLSDMNSVPSMYFLLLVRSTNS